MAYTQTISRANPALLLFLLDHSDSMRMESALNPKANNAQVLAEAVNLTLGALVHNAVDIIDGEEVVKHYFDVGLIGYSGSESYWAYEGGLRGHQGVVSLSDLAHNVERVETVDSVRQTTSGEVVQTTRQVPIFVESHWRGRTPMVHALGRAAGAIREWLDDPAHRASFPPVVINVTDGEPTDGDPIPVADQIMELNTADGGALVFNCHLSSFQNDRVLFPASEDGVPANSGAQRLYRMSSMVPPKMVEYGRTLAPPIQIAPGGRGFLYQADGIDLIRLLDIGTRGVEDVYPTV